MVSFRTLVRKVDGGGGVMSFLPRVSGWVSGVSFRRSLANRVRNGFALVIVASSLVTLGRRRIVMTGLGYAPSSVGLLELAPHARILKCADILGNRSVPEMGFGSRSLVGRDELCLSLWVKLG